MSADNFKEKQHREWVLDRIAEMICGNEPYKKYFPYRPSSQLTDFFSSMGLTYIHRGETRKTWVLNVLQDLNQGFFTYSNVLSNNVVDVVEHLFDLGYFIDFLERQRSNPFISDSTVDQSTIEKYEKAIAEMNVVLKATGLCLFIDDKKRGVKISANNTLYISSASREHEVKKVITFNPSVFKIPSEKPQTDFVAVMMPFSKEFDGIYAAIKRACTECNLVCQRADNIWEDSVIVQDIFNLIYRSSIIISDFSTKNSNVLYETGIAHTLGKVVIPISRSIDDVPFDLRHHRVATYHPNNEGIQVLGAELTTRLRTVIKKVVFGK